MPGQTPQPGRRNVPPPGPMRTAAFVVNRTRIRDPRRLFARCREAAGARGWHAVFLETTVDDPGPGLARQAVAAGARLVFAVGGDGTVRACAHALAGSSIPLAIVPRGTANLVAHALGIPSRLGPALAVGLSGHERRIDLGSADGVIFAAMAGMGLDAAVVGATSRRLKDRAGWLAYAIAALPHIAGRPATFRVALDGAAPLTRQARSVVVGVAGLLPGGFAILPGARLDDGLLDVGILAPSFPVGWARVARRVLAGSHHDDRHLERFRARQVEIRAEADLPREADGEVIPPGSSLTVTVLPAALLVRVPGPP